MFSFKKTALLLIVTTGPFFISCKEKPKPGAESIVGKWEYKELIYKSSNSYADRSEKEKQRRKEEDDRKGKGTIFIFNKDNSFSITSPAVQHREAITGTYATKNGVISMTKKGEKKPETATISFPGKNMLQIDDQESGLILVLSKIQ